MAIEANSNRRRQCISRKKCRSRTAGLTASAGAVLGLFSQVSAGASTADEIRELKQQIRVYQEKLQSLDDRLRDQENKAADAVKAPEPKVAADSRPGEDKSTALHGSYDGGFTLKTDDNKYLFRVNGLAQARYTLNLPETRPENQTFDLALGRLFFSGTVFDPNLSYFFFYQTSTLADTNRVDTIDWWLQYKLGNVTLKGGRLLPQYSRQFYNDIGKYLFMDLHEPEYAFSLQRTPGAEVVWHPGNLTLSLTAGNSVRALDSVTQQNSTAKIAGIFRANYDILAPYTYVQESDPKNLEAPQLSVGAAIAFNPIDAASGLQNVQPGDNTLNATADFGYRKDQFSTQAAVFWRQVDHRSNSISGVDQSDDYGWYWQAGYFVLPKRLEFGARVAQVSFDDANGAAFKESTAFGAGFNYYIYEHGFKFQGDYTYIDSDTFSGIDSQDHRLRLQAQVYF